MSPTDIGVDRTSALIVMALSLACTAMAMFDLLLLASGH
jgi:hypothetical protein